MAVGGGPTGVGNMLRNHNVDYVIRNNLERASVEVAEGREELWGGV